MGRINSFDNITNYVLCCRDICWSLHVNQLAPASLGLKAQALQAITFHWCSELTAQTANCTAN